jgi:hypothetical protein
MLNNKLICFILVLIFFSVSNTFAQSEPADVLVAVALRKSKVLNTNNNDFVVQLPKEAEIFIIGDITAYRVQVRYTKDGINHSGYISNSGNYYKLRDETREENAKAARDKRNEIRLQITNYRNNENFNRGQLQQIKAKKEEYTDVGKKIDDVKIADLSGILVDAQKEVDALINTLQNVTDGEKRYSTKQTLKDYHNEEFNNEQLRKINEIKDKYYKTIDDADVADLSGILVDAQKEVDALINTLPCESVGPNYDIRNEIMSLKFIIIAVFIFLVLFSIVMMGIFYSLIRSVINCSLVEVNSTLSDANKKKMGQFKYLSTDLNTKIDDLSSQFKYSFNRVLPKSDQTETQCLGKTAYSSEGDNIVEDFNNWARNPNDRLPDGFCYLKESDITLKGRQTITSSKQASYWISDTAMQYIFPDPNNLPNGNVGAIYDDSGDRSKKIKIIKPCKFLDKNDYFIDEKGKFEYL